MKKIAWPWIGSTPHEMGSMSPDGDLAEEWQSETQERHDTLVPEKSVLDDQETVMEYKDGIMSPVDGIDTDVDFASDSEEMLNKASVEVYDEDGVLANFCCNIASTIQDKVAGLQPYDNLLEGAGLIFPYKNPEDVIYHMGTVRFPIDIIFIDSSDRVKKIYKNIQPGTLGTFGCANVKNVLEICGGLSDRLGIRNGNKISIKNGKDSELSSVSRLNKVSSIFGINRKVIVKYSSMGRTRFSNWNGFPVLTISDSITKTAGQDKIISDLISKFTNTDENKKIYAFDFDGLIEESPMVRVYKTSEVIEDEVPFIRIDGHTVSIDKTEDGNEIYRDVHLYELVSEGINNDESIISSLNKSFSYLLNSPKIIAESAKIFDEIRSYSKENDSRIIIVTRSPNPEYLKKIICNRINLHFGENLATNIESLTIPKEADASDIVDAIRKNCGNHDITIFSDDSLLKRAGVPISDEVKSEAKKVYKSLRSALEISEKSLENMKKNLAEYEKIKDNPDAIRKSKGQYNQSVKRNTRVVRDYLIKIRDAVKILNSIKDASTTIEIIDSLASSAKVSSDSAEEIFDLIEQVEAPDFHMILTEKINNYERTIEDLKSSLERGMEYINTEILGLLILSD